MRFYVLFLALATLAYVLAIPRHTKVNLLNLAELSVAENTGDTALSCDPLVLSRSGDELMLSWSTEEDGSLFLGAYLEPTPTQRQVPLIKYQDISSSSSSSSSSLAWSMVNYRSSYLVSLFTGSLDRPVELQTCQVSFESAHEPTGVHLALTELENTWRVSWTSSDSRLLLTEENEKEEKEDEAYVARIRPIASTNREYAWEYVTKDTAFSYDRFDLCGSRASSPEGWLSPGVLMSALFPSLKDGVRYEYQVFGERLSKKQVEELDARQASSLSPFYSFEYKNFNQPNHHHHQDQHQDEENENPWGSSSIRLGFFGDMGVAETDGSTESGIQEPPSTSTFAILQAHHATNPLDGIFHIGDISYAMGWEFVWDEFLHFIEPLAATVPYMTAVGNHERDFNTSSLSNKYIKEPSPFTTARDSYGECGLPYSSHFLMPSPSSSSSFSLRGSKQDRDYDLMYYATNAGPLHVIVMSTEHDYSEGSDQYDFIVNDLKHIDRKKTPWVVFTGHRPMYVNSTYVDNGDGSDENYVSPGDQNVASSLQAVFEPLFSTFEVDLAFWGHHHSFQRTCPVLGYVCVGEPSPSTVLPGTLYSAPVHVVMGMAGQSLSQNLDVDQIYHDELIYEVVDDQHYGMTILEANQTHLSLSYYIVDEQKEGGELYDELWLIKE